MSVQIDVIFRWARTIPTRVGVIYLRAPFLKPFPVPLHWNKALEVYESAEVSAPQGTHLAELDIDGCVYQLDAFEVHSFTFQVELVILDDREYRELSPSGSGKSVKSSRAPRSRHNSRGSTVTEANQSHQSSRRTSLTDVDLDTPRTDITEQSYIQDITTMSDSSIKRSNMYADLVRQQLHNGDRDNDASSLKSDRSGYSQRSERSLISDKYQGEGDKLYNGQELRGHNSKQSSRAPSGAASLNGEGRGSGPHTPQGSQQGSRAPSVHENGSRQGSVRGEELSIAGSLHSNGQMSNHGSRASSVVDQPHSTQGSRPASGYDRVSNQGSRAPSVQDERVSNQGSRAPSIRDERVSNQGSRAPSVHDERISNQGSRAPSIRDDRVSNQGSRAPSVHDERISNQGSRAPSIHDDRVSNQGSRAPSVHDERISNQGSCAPSIRGDAVSNQGSRAPSVHDERISNQGSRAPSIRGDTVSNQGSRAPSVYDDRVSNQGSRAPSVHDERVSNQGSRAPSVYDDMGSQQGSRAPSVHESNQSHHGSRGQTPNSFHSSRVGSVHEGSMRATVNGDSYGQRGSGVDGFYEGSRAESVNGSITGAQSSRAGSVRNEETQSRPGSHPEGGTNNRPPSAGSGRPPSNIPVRTNNDTRSPIGPPQYSSRPGSIASSERELNQFFEADNRYNMHRQSPHTFTDQLPDDLRHSGTTSLPVLSPQRSQTQEKRSYTPDTYTRSLGPHQPKVQSPLVTSRTLPLPRSGSQTATPVAMNGDEDDSAVATLKKLLANRDVEARSLHQEIDILKQQLRTLNESSNLKFANKPDVDRMYNDVLKEKENLETEVWKLKQEIDQLRTGGTDNGNHGDALNNFSRNSPNVLQRKIEDLESQIQDLQEANETAVAEISNLEKVNREQQEELESLKTANNLNLEDLQNENQRLRDQIDQMNEQHTNILLNEDSSDDVMQLRSDIQQMRIDLRALREKNHHLKEENIRLREDNHDLRRGTWKPGSGRLNDTQNSGDRMETMDRTEQFRKERNAALDEVRTLRDQLYELKKEKTNTSPPMYSDHVTSYLEQQDSYLRPDDRVAGKYRTPSKWDGPQIYPEHNISPTGSDKSDSTALLMTGFGQAPVIGENFGIDLPDVIEEEPSPRGSSKGHHKYGLYDDDVVSLSTTTTELLQPTNKYASLPNLTTAPRVHSDVIASLTDPTNTDIATSLKYYDPTFPAAISESSSVSSLADNYDDLTLIGDEQNGTARSHHTGSPRSPRAGTGFRSVSPPVTVTQHNKGEMGSGREMLSTAGKRPFAPRSPADVNLGDVVKFTNKNGKISRGTVKYVGHLPNRNECYLGVELEYSDGKHDGVYMGQRYFKCKPNKGVFVAFNKIVMVWGR